MSAHDPVTERNLDGYGAPAAGPPPWDVYRMTPTTVFALGTAEPWGATRFRL